jgi:undecaprenyl-phosphate 4-deoxy-4-formamido-L-arabinose transferase
MIDLSVVIPCFKSHPILKQLIKNLNETTRRLGLTSEIILVLDEDNIKTLRLLLEIKESNSNIRIIQLVKNFGQNLALLAGVNHAVGAYILTMDDDYQHDPKHLKQLMDAMIESIDVVYAVPKNELQSFFRNKASILYKSFFLSRIGIRQSANFSAFRLIRKSCISANLNSTRASFLDLMLVWSTDRVASVEVNFNPRLQGKSNYNFRSLFKIATSVALSYSDFSLKLILKLGIFSLGFSFLFAIYTAFKFISGSIALNGFTSIVALILLFSSIEILILGIIGMYVSMIQNEIMNKPKYVVRQVLE